jgi:D-3-phosphoglycerate dehydrogenase
MENIVFEGAEAAVARINLDGEPSSDLCATIKSRNEDILDLQVVKLGARSSQEPGRLEAVHPRL